MGVLFFSAHQSAFLVIAAVIMAVLAQTAGLCLRIAAVSVGMLVQAAGLCLRIAAVPMSMLIQAAGLRLRITALSMGMLFQFTDLHRAFRLYGLFRVLACLCRHRSLLRSFLIRRSVCLRLCTYERLLFPIAVLAVFMELMLFQCTYQLAFFIKAVIVMYMDHIIRISAHENFCSLLCFLITLVCMFMHLVLAFQHLHFMCHRLPIQLQVSQRSQDHASRQTQENHHPAPVLFLFLQELSSPR